MARSASHRAAAAALAALALGALAGCDSTQSKNRRAKLEATRALESRKALRVERANPDVRVTGISVVRGDDRSVLVVEMRSSARTPVTDVPIAVGLRTRHGRRVALNAKAGLEWFQTHVPAVPAGGTATWVFTTRREIRRGDRPFARVGDPASPPISRASALPALRVSPLPSGRVLVENASKVPQYGLQVYLVAGRPGRWVAAGRATLRHLGTSGRATVRVPLTGAPNRGRLSAHAIPTIFQ